MSATKPRSRRIRSCMRTKGRFGRHHRRLIAVLRREPAGSCYYDKRDMCIWPGQSPEVEA